MVDRLRAGIPSRYVTSQLGQLSLASLRGRLIEYTSFGWGKGGNVTSVVRKPRHNISGRTPRYIISGSEIDNSKKNFGCPLGAFVWTGGASICMNFRRCNMSNYCRRALFRRSLCLELTSWAYAAININSCLQALTEDISTPADITPSALETIIFFIVLWAI